MNQIKCNICGIPETEWVGGWCKSCASTCEMAPNVVIDQRVYSYAKKNGLLNGTMFDKNHILNLLEKPQQLKKAPQYFREAVSKDGKVFSSLQEFPKDKVFRVCHDSKDGTFRTGALVWRGAPAPGGLDGINFIQEAACLDAEFCDKALEGACFEESFHKLHKRGE